MAGTVYDIPVKKIDGSDATLRDYAGKVMLIVNVASKCGLTKQYEGLEKLHEDYAAKGLAVLGFPANDFAGQEPGTEAEIADFCSATYGVKFPMFSKITVKGDGKHALYKQLISERPSRDVSGDGNLKKILDSKGLAAPTEQDVMWNFEKFLVDRSGKVVARIAPDVAPDSSELISRVESALAS